MVYFRNETSLCCLHFFLKKALEYDSCAQKNLPLALAEAHLNYHNIADVSIAVYTRENFKIMLAIIFLFAEGGHKNEWN
ncbi:MAG: hypothetical protein WCR31_12680 [Treponema sp.]